jgi:predicted CopG family antitoxin
LIDRRARKQIDIIIFTYMDGVTMYASSAIYIREDLKEKLQKLKRHPEESYNSVIERLVTSPGDHDPQCAEAIKGLEEALEDIMHHLTILKKGL